MTERVAARRHAGVVRVTHWLIALAFVALLVTGVEILLSHPRFYWGEAGNVNMRPLFTLPVPSSRDTVPTGYKYVLPDQNGWSRYLHFEAAWVVVLCGLVYGVWGFLSGHFRRELFSGAQGGRLRFREVVGKSLRWEPVEDEGAYNVAQRWSYVGVIFGLIPLMIWTGLAMSPSFTAAAPWSVELLGGRQSARTIHFFATWVLVLFVMAHVAMVVHAGFRKKMRGMITGGAAVAEGPLRIEEQV